MRNLYQIIILGACFFAASCNSTDNVKSGGSHENHDSHLMKVNRDGDQVMGFSHEKTKHHFRLFPDGGAIEVSANDASDAESREQIRKHLPHIAQMFSEGNFNAPMLVHSRTPPGVPAMRQMKNEIGYKYEDTERGGRVRISTPNGEALASVHEFLRFQFADHQTGDSGEVTKE